MATVYNPSVDLEEHAGLLECSEQDLYDLYKRQANEPYHRDPFDLYQHRIAYIERCQDVIIRAMKSYTEVELGETSRGRSNLKPGDVKRRDNKYSPTDHRPDSKILYWAYHEFNAHCMMHDFIRYDRRPAILLDLEYEMCGVGGCQAASVGPCPVHLQ